VVSRYLTALPTELKAFPIAFSFWGHLTFLSNLVVIAVEGIYGSQYLGLCLYWAIASLNPLPMFPFFGTNAVLRRDVTKNLQDALKRLDFSLPNVTF
jgi:hypothetical protein